MPALRVLLGVLLAGMAFSSLASTYPNRDAVRAVATAGANYVYWPDAPGSAVRIGSATVAAGASNVPTIVRNNLPVPVPGGGTIYGDARVVGTARAIGRALWRYSPYAIAAGLVSDIAPLWTDLGYPLVNGVVTKPDPSVCTVSPCYGYTLSGSFTTGPYSVTTSTRAATCQAYIAHTNGLPNPPYSQYSVYLGMSGNSCQYAVYNRSNNSYVGTYTNLTPSQATVPPQPYAGTPISEADFLDEIATRSGWPSSAAIQLQKSLAYPEIASAFDADVASQTPSINLRNSSGAPVANGTPVPVGAPRVITRNYPHPTTGDPMTETKTETTTGTATGNQVTYNTSTVTTITNNTTNITETVETEEKPAEDIETCGLPGKPACAIDEKNTGEIAEEARTRHNPEQDATDAYNPLKEFLENAESTLPEFPTINWAFTLPTGCAAIALPAFEPFLQQIDVCQFQPLFHDVMTLVWLMGGLFGAIGTFWRNTFATS